MDENSTVVASKRDHGNSGPQRKRKRVLQTSLKEITSANDKNPEVIYKDGLRFIVPYYYKFHVYAKRRWLGKSLLEVFATEFQALTKEYYKGAIACGNLTVNGQITAEDYPLKDNDLIIHSLHRHEPPITGEELKVISQDKNMLVVYKPGSVPIHPTGRYRHNTLIKILELTHQTKLHICHRIDRLTSGIQILTKNAETAHVVTKSFEKHEVKKTYLALCRGQFPPSKTVTDPIKVVCGRTGICSVHPEGKECETHFTLLHYNKDKDESLVRCEPVTGRMHQIRVHLAHYGHCISNDPIYSRSNWCKSGEAGSVKVFSEELSESYYANDTDASADIPADKASLYMPVLGTVDSACGECKARRLLPTQDQMFIYLHAVKYELGSDTYICPLPAWCEEEWVPEDLKKVDSVKTEVV